MTLDEQTMQFLEQRAREVPDRRTFRDDATVAVMPPADEAPDSASEIDAGDYVLHRPTGEKWVVACVQGDRLSWSGWPEGMADLADCELVKKATPEARDKTLATWAGIKDSDHRARYARHRLGIE